MPVFLLSSPPCVPYLCPLGGSRLCPSQETYSVRLGVGLGGRRALAGGFTPPQEDGRALSVEQVRAKAEGMAAGADLGVNITSPLRERWSYFSLRGSKLEGGGSCFSLRGSKLGGGGERCRYRKDEDSILHSRALLVI